MIPREATPPTENVAQGGTPAVVATGAAAGPARTGGAGEWLIWHAGELLALGVPVVLTAAVSLWFLPLVALIAAAWANHEYKLARRHRAATPKGGGKR